LTNLLQLATYRLVAGLIRALPLPGKAGASLAGRREAVERWIAWGRQAPSRSPRIWLHAASVGEALAAEPVIRRLRSALPDAAAVLTYSSPSLERWADSLGYDAVGYAPPEEPAAVSAVFQAIRPDLVVLSRSDLWPEVLIAAAARGVPVAVVGATVRAGSGRLRWPVRTFLRGLLEPVRFVGAATVEDAARWRQLGIPESVLAVTGDPRHDQVLERLVNLNRFPGLGAWVDGAPALVAGSVEESDESVLFGGQAILARQRFSSRLLVVPHDPTLAVVKRIEKRARASGIGSEVFEPGREPSAPCVIIAQRGALADLYALGFAGYVGGGFEPRGLHAVIEAAAYGLPVAFGPEYRWSIDAARLVESGGGVPLPRSGAAKRLAACWRTWAENGGERWRVGIAARGTLRQGAADLTARHLLSLMER
jgi:3-deoxy-D-manno-octulosonic-acid transferase